jgi:putative Mn2+ efflux pump MntP
VIATIVLFASLGLDTLAVSLGVGISGLSRARWLRLGLTFAAFEGGMPIVGLLVGRRLGPNLGAFAAYLAAVLLLAIGVFAIRDALDDDGDAARSLAQASMTGRSLLLTGFSVGLDELAAGFSLGVLGAALGPALGYIAVQAFVLTIAGLFLGERVGARLGERAELASGVALCLLAVALVINEATGAGFL